jgi:inositol polyphosphate 5-phosphatase INPP5B/F
MIIIDMIIIDINTHNNNTDHRPVTAQFECTGKRINPKKEKEVYLELVRMVDKWENDNVPKVELQERFIEFPVVAYKETISSKVTLKNKGMTDARWLFIKKDFDLDSHGGLVCKDWVQIEPCLGVLLAGETLDICVSVCVEALSAQRLISGSDKMEDILILHVEDGCDFFITISGNFDHSTYEASGERPSV